MLCLDGATVAKPLVSREQLFYETLPAPLRPFVPSFHGALEVRVLQGEGGYVTHAATPPALYRPHMASITTRRSRIRLHDSGDIEIEGENEGMVFEDDDEEREQLAADKSEEEWNRKQFERTSVHRPSVGHALNPWVLRCHRESLSGLTPGAIQNFILLENLTSRFKQPCVLDLKVGTRQYGDSASPAKVRSKMMKVATTTSGKLGLRLGGMQVYQVTTRRFLCRNKLFGRALTVEGFRTALVQFLHNGWYIRLDVVRPLLERLEMLEKVLTRLCSARFYTCSLLCLYEGELKTPSTTPLSPSTPALPITPGPFSTMPPGSFTSSSNRFTFPMANSEANASVSSAASKVAIGHCANDGEKSAIDREFVNVTSLPASENQTFPKTVDDTSCLVSALSNSQFNCKDSESNTLKAMDETLSDGVNIQRESEPCLFRHNEAVSHTCLDCHTNPCKPCLHGGETADQLSLDSKEIISKLQKSSVSPEMQNAFEPSHNSLPFQCDSVEHPHTSSSTQFSSQPPPKEDINRSSTTIQLHHLYQQNQQPNSLMSSSVIPAHTEKTSMVDNATSSQNFKLLHSLTKKVDTAINEEDIAKSERKQRRQNKCAVGRSVSADSVSYDRVEDKLIKMENKLSVSSLVKMEKGLLSKADGYEKGKDKDWVTECGKERQKRRSHSMECQISFPSDQYTNNQNKFVENCASFPCYDSISPLVDVRLIDFAHSTHRGLSDPVSYAGPDQGFLFGLHNLINILRDIAQEATNAMHRC